MIYCKKVCKCHSVPPPCTTIKKEKRKKIHNKRIEEMKKKWLVAQDRLSERGQDQLLSEWGVDSHHSTH
jgi:hypothetical protein